MTKRKMYLRMIVASLLRRRSRMLIALLSIGIGATVLSGMITVYRDVPRQMGAQFRSYGANMILLPAEGEKLTTEAADKALALVPSDKVVGATPYRYVRLDMVSRQQSFTAAGTDFAQIQKTSPYFKVDGEYPVNHREALVGKKIAEAIGVQLGSVMKVTYKPEGTASSTEFLNKDATANASLQGSAEGWSGEPVYVSVKLDEVGKIAELTVDASTQTEDIGGRCEKAAFTDCFIGKRLPLALGRDIDAISGATQTCNAVVNAINTAKKSDGQVAERNMNLTVTGILETGGEEENTLFMSLDDLGALTGESDRLDVMELSVSASSENLDSYSAAIQKDVPNVSSRLVKRVTKSETAVLSKLQALVFLVTIIILVLTMVCVSTTMMAVVAERRREIGLRKALGASDQSIRAEFLGEGMFLGFLGGLLGAVLGFAFAQTVSVNVFHSSIHLEPLLVPVTVLISMLVAALSCLLPIKRAVEVDPALVLKGE